MKTFNQSFARIKTYSLYVISVLLLGSCSKEEITLDNQFSGDTTSNVLVDSNRILIDASHDGGGWWFPQSPITGFSNTEHHQGKALADYLISKGFQVDELPRDTIITKTLLNHYVKVIRAGKYGDYLPSELEAYQTFVERPGTSLILISEYLRENEKDELAEQFGVTLSGSHYGYVTNFASHSITQSATSFYYNAGSVVTNTSGNPAIEVLGWVNSYPAMGILHHPKSKIFFIGDINGIEGMPQPFIDNLIDWAF